MHFLCGKLSILDTQYIHYLNVKGMVSFAAYIFKFSLMRRPLYLDEGSVDTAGDIWETCGGDENAFKFNVCMASSSKNTTQNFDVESDADQYHETCSLVTLPQ